MESWKKGIATDRIPPCPVASRCNVQPVGASVREFLTVPEIMVKAQITSYERYKPDIIVMKGDSLMEAETLGNEFRFPEDSNCFTTRMALEDKGKLNSLKLPDPRREGRMKGYLKAVTEASTKRRMTLPRNLNRSPNCLIWRDKPQAEVTSVGAL